eukprot:gene6912-9465_t
MSVQSMVLIFFILLQSIFEVSGSNMPLPFTRELSEGMTGNDVLIAQNLLKRDKSVSQTLQTDGSFGSQTYTATSSFQLAVGLKSTGTIDASTAQYLLDLHSADGYKDSGFSAGSMGYLYKFHIPVHSNRSIETSITLFDKENNVLMKFTGREHGHRDDGSNMGWPDFGDGDYGLNEFTSNGNTVTGLVEVDLNSPEPNPDLYGPWPVNRIVRGLDGNALFLIPNIRDGILIHTGNWSTADSEWNPTMDMPNSSGCIHGHPSNIEQVYKTLVGLGVKVNDNPFSGKNYPYKPQGIAVIELID